MKRPVLITIVHIIHLLLALFLAGSTIYLVILIKSPRTLDQPGAADTIYGLSIGAISVAVSAVLLLVAVWGLAGRRRWGWWLSTTVDVLMFAAFTYGSFDEDSYNWDVLPFIICFAGCLILLLLPKVRRFYLNPPALPAPAIMEAS